MGVPAFFRWLSKKYPSIVVHAAEEKPPVHEELDTGSNAVKSTPIYNTTLPNPNDVEFDNLYLDMNGIIHPCCHPENKPAPRNEDEMMVLIFEYIDRLFNIVRPRRLLYMAIDGVAPRAKMNQQRSRRFRSAKESVEKFGQINEMREKLARNGYELPPAKEKGEHFDSNCITPGTEFMDRLAVCLRFYVHQRVTNDEGWAKIQVILSDANVPGEGEHKIMDYIRKQRASPNHDPNTHHCLCGADADLIMLGLATHEAQFTIIREEFRPNAPRTCELCNQYGHEMADCKGLSRDENPAADKPILSDVEFIFLRLSVLREYLEREFADLQMQAPQWYNFERVLDDWVFMCFFVGNDFLPHLPSLEIREGAIDRLIRIYKRNFVRMNGYLANAGIVDLSRVEKILMDLGQDEDDIFRQRHQREAEFKQREKDKAKRARFERHDSNRGGMNGGSGRYGNNNAEFMASWNKPMQPHEFRAAQQQRSLRRDLVQSSLPNSDNQQLLTDDSNKTSAAKLKAFLVEEVTTSITTVNGSSSSTSILSVVKVDDQPNVDSASNVTESAVAKEMPETSGKRLKRTHSQAEADAKDAKPANDDDADVDAAALDESDNEDEVADDIRLHEEGWRERYFTQKFSVPVEDQSEFRAKVAAAYVEGLCWVLRYYYQGCASWKWYFSYHYAPFASDFKGIGALSIEFERNTKPFKPLEQLMAVFPAASKQFLPKTWQPLMFRRDSPIIDFYPRDFDVDLNGKKFAWQGVALLPHVDEDRLLHMVENLYHTLSFDEKRRNSLGSNILFVGRHHTLHSQLTDLYANDNKSGVEVVTASSPVQVKTDLAYGMAGAAWPLENFKPSTMLPSPIGGLESLQQTFCVAVYYADPHYPVDFLFSATRLPQALVPERVLRPDDYYPSDRRGGYGGRGGNNDWRGPHIGFNATRGRGRLDESGHRHIYHAVRRGGGADNSSAENRGGAAFGPPSSYYSNQQRNNYGGYGSSSAGGGGGGNNGGRSGGSAFYQQSRRPYDDRNNQQDVNYNDSGSRAGSSSSSSFDNKPKRDSLGYVVGGSNGNNRQPYTTHQSSGGGGGGYAHYSSYNQHSDSSSKDYGRGGRPQQQQQYDSRSYSHQQYSASNARGSFSADRGVGARLPYNSGGGYHQQYSTNSNEARSGYGPPMHSQNRPDRPYSGGFNPPQRGGGGGSRGGYPPYKNNGRGGNDNNNFNHRYATYCA